MATKALSTRRAVLKSIPAVGIAAVTPIAAEAAIAELPVTRVNRLAFELSRAMTEWMDDLGYGGVPDLWKAHVYPSSYSEWPVSFQHLGVPAYAEDPLVDAIGDFRAGMAAYSAADDESPEFANATYGAPMDVLSEWDQPARTRQGAIAALKLAKEELSDFLSNGPALPMVTAALAYFDREVA